MKRSTVFYYCYAWETKVPRRRVILDDYMNIINHYVARLKDSLLSLYQYYYERFPTTRQLVQPGRVERSELWW